MLATEWDKDRMKGEGWWMSEKYDGIRAMWIGNQLFTRTGKQIKIPDEFRISLPPISLDGELWIQYGLQQTSLQLTKSPKNKYWENVVFQVFDTIDTSLPFEERQEQLTQLKSKMEMNNKVRIIPMIKCKNEEHLQHYFDTIIKKGGEGIILREPNSMYTPGRSYSMRKYKEFQDTEVLIIKDMFPHGFICKQYVIDLICYFLLIILFL